MGKNKTQSAPFTGLQAHNTPMLNIRDELCVGFGRFGLYSDRLGLAPLTYHMIVDSMGRSRSCPSLFNFYVCLWGVDEGNWQTIAIASC